MAIASLAYKITADTRGFSAGISATRKELRAAKQVMEQTRTPAEKLQGGLAGLARLYEKGLVDLTSYRRGVATLKAELGATTQKVNRFGAAVKKIGGGLRGVGGFAKRAALPMTALASAGLGFAAASVKMAADIEQSEIAFSKLTGSMDTAKVLMGDLRQFAAGTPFQLPGITDAARMLAAFGVETEQIVPTLRSLGDISAGTNNEIAEIAEIFGKAKVQGRLFADDINQLTGRGIPVIGALAETMGVAETQVKALVTEGKVGFPELQNAFVSMTAEGSTFGGMMEAQSQTLAGSYSTLKDNITQAMAEIGGAIASELDLTSISQQITQFVQLYKADFVAGFMDGLKFIGDGWDVMLRGVDLAQAAFFGLRGVINTEFAIVAQIIDVTLIQPLKAAATLIDAVTGSDLAGPLRDFSEMANTFSKDMLKQGRQDFRRAGEEMASAFGDGSVRSMFKNLGETTAAAQAEQMKKLAPTVAAEEVKEQAAAKQQAAAGQGPAFNVGVLKGSAEALRVEATLAAGGERKKELSLLKKIENNTRAPIGSAGAVSLVGVL